MPKPRAGLEHTMSGYAGCCINFAGGATLAAFIPWGFAAVVGVFGFVACLVLAVVSIGGADDGF